MSVKDFLLNLKDRFFQVVFRGNELLGCLFYSGMLDTEKLRIS